jgi:Domain of unknown function (DUF1707)
MDQTSRSRLRASDAERDTVVTELGEHFGQGRLDRAEFDERMTQALAARTEGDLDALLADLPSARETASPPRTRPQRPPVAVPLVIALILITAFTAGGGRHGWAPWPLLWLLPVMILRLAWWRGGQPARRDAAEPG